MNCFYRIKINVDQSNNTFENNQNKVYNNRVILSKKIFQSLGFSNFINILILTTMKLVNTVIQSKIKKSLK